MNKNELIMLQSLPLEIKLAKFYRRLHEWVHHWGEDKCYISFSGGIDSLLLLRLVRDQYPNIPAVFSDTGLEFPEIRKFVFAQDNITIIKPKKTVNQVITDYGYPVVSKTVSDTIYKLKNQNLSHRYKNYLLNGDERGKYGMLPKKYQYLINSDFSISGKCCDVMKKQPLKAYEKETGRIAIMTGEMADESRLRERVYLKNGCNAFNRKSGPKSTLLGPWLRNDVLTVLKNRKEEIPSVYGEIVEVDKIRYAHGETISVFDTTKLKRTGCMFCPLGLHMEKCPNRLDQLAETHPSVYSFCMRGGTYNDKGLWVPDKGLGMSHVLDILKIPYKDWKK